MSDPQPLRLPQPAIWIGNSGVQPAQVSFTPWRSHGGEQPRVAEHDAPEEPEQESGSEPTPLHADSFAQGFAEGQRSVRVEVAGERAALVRLTRSLEALRPEPTNALAALLAETVERLVRQIVGNAGIDSELLVVRAEQAAALIGEEVEPTKLRVHPDDLPLLASAEIPVKLVGDAALVRGSIVLECGSGWVEDGPAVRLDRLKAALDRLGAPE